MPLNVCSADRQASATIAVVIDPSPLGVAVRSYTSTLSTVYEQFGGVLVCGVVAVVVGLGVVRGVVGACQSLPILWSALRGVLCVVPHPRHMNHSTCS